MQSVDDVSPTRKRSRHVSFAANVVSSVVQLPPLSPDASSPHNESSTSASSSTSLTSCLPLLSDRCLAWLAQMEALDVALSQFQSRQQVALLSKVAAWVAVATKRAFGVTQLGEILAIAPEFYHLSRLTNPSNSINNNAALLASLVIGTPAPLEPQLQSRRVEFRNLLAQLQDAVDVVPADIVALVRNPLAPLSSPVSRRRRVGDDETASVDDRSPLRSAVVAQRRIDALLGHPSVSDNTAHNDSSTLVSHAELADQRGRELAALAARHLERQPLLSAADSGIDILRSKFSQAKRATLPIDEVMSTLQVGLAITPAQAVTVLGYLLDAVPQWISKAQFGANAFVSIKPLSIMSTNAVHEAFLAHCSRKRDE